MYRKEYTERKHVIDFLFFLFFYILKICVFYISDNLHTF